MSEIDATHVMRKAWQRQRSGLGLTDETPDDGFGFGGLAEFSEPLDVRIVILPGAAWDSSPVPLDFLTAEWIETERPPSLWRATDPVGPLNLRDLTRSCTGEMVPGRPTVDPVLGHPSTWRD